jgi:hypothetical protein
MTNNLTDVLLGPPQLAEPLDWLNRAETGPSLHLHKRHSHYSTADIAKLKLSLGLL